MTVRLIVNADDYGRTAAVDEGIRAAHLEGIVTSTSAMMNLPGVEDELRLALKQTPALGLGVHLVLTSGRPLLPPEQVRSLVDADGNFWRPGAFLERLASLDPDQVRAEWRAQVEKFRGATGRNPTHLDSHHHASYFSEMLFSAMLELADECQAPIRNPLADSGKQGFPAELMNSVREFVPHLMAEHRSRRPDHFVCDFYDQGATKASLLAILDSLHEGTTEIMTHPGLYTDELARLSSYAAQREIEFQILTDAEVAEAVSQKGIELITFAAL
ncbi:MAG: carbohydrate deacetylase [Anaerolineales bacterium]